MKGTFFITLEYLKELGACRDGQRAFSEAFPEGGEYQAVLDRCAEEDRLDFAGWLLTHVGPTSDIRTYESELNAPDKNIVFAGTLLFRENVKMKSIAAGGSIEAGLSAHQQLKEQYAVVISKEKPQNLAPGVTWRQKE